MDYAKVVERILKVGGHDPNALREAMTVCKAWEQEGCIYVTEKVGWTTQEVPVFDENNFRESHIFAKRVRTLSASLLREGKGSAEGVYRSTLLFDAPHNFDAFCQYIELDREPKRKFYVPRRAQLLPVAEKLQELETGDLELLAISLPPGVGKTTLAIFFLAWISGRKPGLQSLIGSHNNDFLRGVYDECMRIFQRDGEYLWGDVFPGVGVCSTNAKDMRIDLGTPKRFQTLEYTSIGSGNAGKVRATHLLYCDDLVKGIEQAMSRDQMEKLWQQYTVDLRQRKQGDIVKELHIATRWSLNDPIGKLERIYGETTRDGKKIAEFINIPALDAEGESNFDYPYGVGFSRAMYEDLKASMDQPSWEALYMGHPIEREGQLYAEDELRYYFSMPEDEPDAIYSVVDTKDQGSDFCCMPVAYQYGDDYYIEAFICDNGKPEIIEERLAQCLYDHKVKLCRFESNRAGGRVAERVDQLLKDKGGFTSITTKYNTSNKETRIEVNSAWVKKHCLFKDESVYKSDKEYYRAMRFLTTYTMMGKNAHDDVPDAMAELADFIHGRTSNRAAVIRRFF